MNRPSRFAFALAALLFSLNGFAEDLADDNSWVKIDEGKTGERAGSMLVYAADTRQMLLVGSATKAALVQAFDSATRAWSDVSTASPMKDALHAYYQTTYDPGTKTVFCLSGGSVLYAFNTVEKTWKTLPPAPELDKLSWQILACDTVNKKLVVVGSDKTASTLNKDELGWMRTVVYDIASGKWTTLKVHGEGIVREHRNLVTLREALIDVTGQIRLAWYRDPKGRGSDAEVEALGQPPKVSPFLRPFLPEMNSITQQVVDRQLLPALKQTRALERKIEDLAEAQFPAPLSRRNSPLVFDAKNGVFVLFGGDHEDYLMNDTWVLDLAKGAWRRAQPDLAPSPRAGHALCALPGVGGVVLYEGYVQSTSEDYGASPSTPIDPVQLWRFDPKTDRWELHASSPISAAKDDLVPAPAGTFYGYASDKFSPPALAADASDQIVFVRHASKDGKWKRPSQTWMLRFDPAKSDADARAKLGTPPNQRLYRGGEFTAAYCEVPDAPADTALDALPENKWTKLPAPPRNPCRGCRQHDWGTSVWDSDREQILLWGGGHKVRSASTVAHYSPASGRIVEGYDADEPYGGNGGGGFDSSLLNRPWISVHNYCHYAYDPKCKLIVAGRGYLYDPSRMDWLRMEPLPLPYKFEWGSTVLKGSAHGAVAWARKKNNTDDAGLWLFDRDKGWESLDPTSTPEQKGKLFVPYCDASGMVYDSKRDRMIFSGVGGGYGKMSQGTFLAFDFKTHALSPIVPQNAEKARTHNAREMAYVEHADCVLIGELLVEGDKKTGRSLTRIYDCERNKIVLLDAGPVPDGNSVGWMYDAKRKLVYAFTFRGEAWALKLNMAAPKLEE